MFNARSIRNKLCELHYELYNYNSPTDCCIITESWLTNDFPNGLLDPDNKFDIYRCDRVGSRGGGVCVLISKQFKSVQINANINIVDDGFEIVVVDVIAKTTRKLRLISIYRQPRNDSTGIAHVRQLVACLERIILKSGPTFIVGDLNCPHLNWITTSCESNSDSLKQLVDFTVNHGFDQLVHDATRGNNILDVVFVNEPLCVCDVQVVDPFCNSDHNTILFSASLLNDHPIDVPPSATTQDNSNNTNRINQTKNISGKMAIMRQ